MRVTMATSVLIRLPTVVCLLDVNLVCSLRKVFQERARGFFSFPEESIAEIAESVGHLNDL